MILAGYGLSICLALSSQEPLYYTTFLRGCDMQAQVLYGSWVDGKWFKRAHAVRDCLRR